MNDVEIKGNQVKTGQVTNTMQSLRGAVEDLEATVESLESALSSVVNEKNPEKTDEMNAKQVLVPVAEEIDSSSTRVRRTKERISSILERLEL